MTQFNSSWSNASTHKPLKPLCVCANYSFYSFHFIVHCYRLPQNDQTEFKRPNFIINKSATDYNLLLRAQRSEKPATEALDAAL